MVLNLSHRQSSPFAPSLLNISIQAPPYRLLQPGSQSLQMLQAAKGPHSQRSTDLSGWTVSTPLLHHRLVQGLG